MILYMIFEQRKKHNHQNGYFVCLGYVAIHFPIEKKDKEINKMMYI